MHKKNRENLMPPLLLSSKRKSKILLDECVMVRKLVKPYLGMLNATDLVPYGTPDDKLLKVAEKNKLTIVTIDTKFVLATIRKEKKIIYQTSDGIRILLTPKIIQTDCNNRKYRCPVTMYIETFDEVILP